MIIRKQKERKILAIIQIPHHYHHRKEHSVLHFFLQCGYNVKCALLVQNLNEWIQQQRQNIIKFESKDIYQQNNSEIWNKEKTMLKCKHRWGGSVKEKLKADRRLVCDTEYVHEVTYTKHRNIHRTKQARTKENVWFCFKLHINKVINLCCHVISAWIFCRFFHNTIYWRFDCRFAISFRRR